MTGAMDLLVSLVKEFEGLARLEGDGMIHCYRCPADYPTQGWGLRVASMNEPPITREQADERLRLALRIYVEKTLRIVPEVAGDDRRVAALSDFCFNLGPVALSSSTMVRRVREGNWEAAATECKRWVHARGRVLPGLVRRRAAEAALLVY